MAKLPAKNLILFVVLVAGLLACALAILSLPWVKQHGVGAPRVEVIARGSGPLSAGVGVAPIDVPLGAPIAGFPHLSYRSDGADPVTARALVLGSGTCRVAVVSAEILLVPDSLRAAVLARLRGVPLSGLVLGATHTHASPGGYYENLAAERLGLGPYEPRMRDLVANAMAEAVRRALANEGPAQLSVGWGRDPDLVRGRDGARPDGRITALRVERPGGQPLAELIVFASHATTLGIRNRRISGDWPAHLYARSRRGVRLLLQGAVGDQSPWLPQGAGPVTADDYAAAVDGAVDALRFSSPDPAPALAYADANVPLPLPAPPVVPLPVRHAATNLAAGLLPTEACVSALRIGPVLLLGAPGEVMGHLAARWRELGGPESVVVSLVDGYLGYLDGDGDGSGPSAHPERTYYGPALAPALERGLSLVVGATREAEQPPARVKEGGARP
ncbi:MAG TPA: neutral/alkaline non-lysosomal ceramidase N-terminal domain-containing protein [Anaeromyxobacter sp.]|nr:neutral/alkaline non-lysosomal ceramidase N-terminal domain-containing protein [Anaeromyxobacter sp.]